MSDLLKPDIKIHIDQATNEQLDYAVAVAKECFSSVEITGGACIVKDGFYQPEYVYNPTANQLQCGELIDEFEICCNYLGVMSGWECRLFSSMTNLRVIATECGAFCRDNSRLIAACKAFLLSVYPDGMIPVAQ